MREECLICKRPVERDPDGSYACDDGHATIRWWFVHPTPTWVRALETMLAAAIILVCLLLVDYRNFTSSTLGYIAQGASMAALVRLAWDRSAGDRVPPGAWSVEDLDELPPGFSTGEVARG